MLVTYTNATSAPLMVQSLYSLIPVGGSITTRRCWADLDADYALKQQVLASEVTLSFTKEPGDDVSVGYAPSMPTYTDTTRPAASLIPIFASIWNSSDSAPNWSDGTNWRDAEGNIT